MRRMKCIATFFILFLALLTNTAPALALIAQEPTQTVVKAKAIAEWLNSIQMKLNQLQMLAQLPQSVLSQIQGMQALMTENFSEVQSILKQVESITHFTDDLEAMLRERHPEWEEGMTIEEMKERNEKRDKQWKETTEAYLKTLNLNAKEFENDEKTREKLMQTLSDADGQVQALQALGALLNHMNSVLARDEQTLQGFMTVYMESERDEIDMREQEEQSLIEAYKSEGWIFAYIGADHDVESVAYSLAIDNRMAFDKSDTGTKKMFGRFLDCRMSIVDDCTAALSSDDLEDDEKVDFLKERSKRFFK